MNRTEPDISFAVQPRAELVAKIRKIAAILKRLCGPWKGTPGDDPLSQLIKTILSQNTTDANSLGAFQTLRERFPTWGQVHRASQGQVAEAIWSGGLARIKARRIKAILRQVCQEYPDFDLSFLASWPTQRIRDFLARFTGVGEKTIACVLLFALGRPVMPVDTHVLRVSKRLGLIPHNADAKKAHQLLQAAVPARLIYPLHLSLIQHGRRICRARSPMCDRCRLSAECLAYPILRAESP